VTDVQDVWGVRHTGHVGHASPKLRRADAPPVQPLERFLVDLNRGLGWDRPGPGDEQENPHDRGRESERQTVKSREQLHGRPDID
jgi:hypothetical protein